MSGSTGWESLVRNADGSVTLQNRTGGGATYTRQGQNLWQPAVGKLDSAGSMTLLSENTDGTFQATDGNRTVTVFNKPEAGVPGHPTRVWVLDAPTIQQTWIAGRLAVLTDPVTQNTINFYYGGDPACPTSTSPGFIGVPAGDLCGVADWGGNVVLLEYVKTPTGPQVGRIASGVGSGFFAQADQIGYDAAGRISSLRGARANTAIASGVVAGLSEHDTRVTTQITYDVEGRVASITAPAGLISGATQPAERTHRAQETFSYKPFTVKAADVTTPTGSLEQVWTDPITMNVTKTKDASGNTTEYTYDAKGQLVLTKDVQSGTVTATTYDKQGRPIEQTGPTRAALDDPNAPHTTTSYDQDEQGKAWLGLATRYWNNARFDETPKSGTTGPIMPGETSIRPTLNFNWPTNPVGKGDWSARLTGLYVPPQTGPYTFRNTTTATLWINGRNCASDCRVQLVLDQPANIQLDVTSMSGGAAGVNVQVTTPDGKTQALPTSALRPNYGLATSSTIREHAASGGNKDLVSKVIYNPVTTQIVATVSPSGAHSTRTYEDYVPANDQWARSTSVTDASGKTTSLTYYAAGETAADCNGQQIPQNSGPKTTAIPGGDVITQVSGGSLNVSDATSHLCGSASADGKSLTTTTTGIGDTYQTTSHPIVHNNPLVVNTTTTSAGVTTSETQKLDTNGIVYETIDAQHTTTTKTWNAYTGLVEHVTEKTAQGEVRTRSYTYTPIGDIATITANGHLLATNTYTTDGTLQATTYPNGAVQTIDLDTNNNVKKATMTYADGTQTIETQTHSGSKRLIGRTLTSAAGTAHYEYFYNDDGRLVDTRLTGTIAATQTAWHNDFAGPAGKNGNRASETITTPHGTIHNSFAYGEDNRLAASNNHHLASGITYDSAGRVTQLGTATLAYDAAGNLQSAAQGTRTYTFTNNGATTTLTTKTSDTTTTSVTATSSGEDLVLNSDGKIAGQATGLPGGTSVILDKTGTPIRWIYNDLQGNATWTQTSTSAPRKTHLYSPEGNPISVERVSAPVTPTDLIVDSVGWKNGAGAATLRLATPIIIMGARSYSPDAGRFLQPDANVNASFNAYEYATSDPINQYDPTGGESVGFVLGVIVSIVAGIAIGVATAGIGTAAAASFGFAGWTAQIMIGAVAGGLSTFAGEVVTQLVDNNGNWAALDWGQIGIATSIGAGIGGALSGVFGGISRTMRTTQNARNIQMKNKTATRAAAQKKYVAEHFDGTESEWKTIKAKLCVYDQNELLSGTDFMGRAALELRSADDIYVYANRPRPAAWEYTYRPSSIGSGTNQGLSFIDNAKYLGDRSSQLLKYKAAQDAFINFDSLP